MTNNNNNNNWRNNTRISNMPNLLQDNVQFVKNKDVMISSVGSALKIDDVFFTFHTLKTPTRVRSLDSR